MTLFDRLELFNVESILAQTEGLIEKTGIAILDGKWFSNLSTKGNSGSRPASSLDEFMAACAALDSGSSPG